MCEEVGSAARQDWAHHLRRAAGGYQFLGRDQVRLHSGGGNAPTTIVHSRQHHRRNPRNHPQEDTRLAPICTRWAGPQPASWSGADRPVLAAIGVAALRPLSSWSISRRFLSCIIDGQPDRESSTRWQSERPSPSRAEEIAAASSTLNPFRRCSISGRSIHRYERKSQFPGTCCSQTPPDIRPVHLETIWGTSASARVYASATRSSRWRRGWLMLV